MKTIRKQTTTKILISVILIIATLIGMGAVSAADNNIAANPSDSVSSDDLALIEISGNVSQCSDGEPFSGVTVTVCDNGTQIASTTTNSDGIYTLSFQSIKRIFTVTASANGHKPSAQEVTVSEKLNGTYTGTSNFKLGNNDAYVYQGWTTNPNEDYTFSDGTTIHLTGATNAFTTIDEGITYATGNPGVNTVYIAPGTYNEYSMSIDASVNLHGENQSTTIIDADDNARILDIWNGANVTIEQLTFRDGSSELGGALRVESGTTNINNCTFDSNTVPDYGGAIYVDPGAIVTISSSTFTDNPSGYSGGAISNRGTLNIDNCTFTSNSAGHFGGAIYNGNGGILTVNGSIFTSNTGPYAGAIRNQEANANIINCIFTSNSATHNGGAINSMGSSVIVTVLGCTFTGNIASLGGAIVNWEANSLTATYNRFYNNIANEGSAIYCVSSSTNVENNWWGSNDPVFGSLLFDVNPPTKWLYMTINATPSTINNTQTSLITVSFNNLCNGTTVTSYTPGVGEYIPDGTPLSFATTLGSIPGTGLHTASGIVTATFTASQTAGTAYISGLLDNYLIPYPVNLTTPFTTVTINPAAFLNITKTVNVTSANVGDIIRYNITITNNGPDNVTTITLKDILPVGTGPVPVYITPPADSLTYGPLGGELTWIDILDSFGGILQPDMSVSILIDVEILPIAAGTTLYNTANITYNVYPYFNETKASVYINPVFVELNKTANNTRPNVGETVQFTIVARNPGPSTVTNLVITDTLPAGLDFVSCTGGGVWDPVTRTITWPSATLLNGANVTYYITALVNSTSLAGTNVTNVVNETHNENPFNSTTNCTVYVPKSDLYIQITSDKNNPKVGETFILTYKLGNNGPDDAENVNITIPLPDGFVISDIKGDGTWIINGNTITWTFNNVTVGDPYLYITGWTARPGTYLFSASIASETYNINSMGVRSLTINAAPQVSAATSNTIGMQNTGAPVAGIILAILMVLGGFISTKKKQ